MTNDYDRGLKLTHYHFFTPPFARYAILDKLALREVASRNIMGDCRCQHLPPEELLEGY